MTRMRLTVEGMAIVETAEFDADDANIQAMIDILQWMQQWVPMKCTLAPCDEPLSLPAGDSGVQEPVDEV